jgi:BirA family biotin operon repressor/biotin-[acetyl-CoA-carboxylase] ligase
MENSHSIPNPKEPLSPDVILTGLRTRLIGQTVHYWPAIGSTNDELKRLAEEGAPEGALAIADEQLAGRGRLDRTWIAPSGSSLLTSLLFRPTFLKPSLMQQLTMVCSLAAADAVTQVTGLQPALKWPNDLLLDGKKLAGVLMELGFALESSSGKTAAIAWAIVGIGLNVNLDFTSVAIRCDSPDLADSATSLAMVLGRRVSRLLLLRAYLEHVEVRYDALRAGHSPHREWASRLVTLGQHVTVESPDGVCQGVAEAVDEIGALKLRQSDGRVKRILAGDVAPTG